MADFMSAATVPGRRSPASGGSGRAGARGLAWPASIAAGAAGLLAVPGGGMVAYFGLTISLGHR